MVPELRACTEVLDGQPLVDDALLEVPDVEVGVLTVGFVEGDQSLLLLGRGTWRSITNITLYAQRLNVTEA